MNWIKRLLDAFRPVRPRPLWPPMGDEKAIAARYARGNVYLQTGRLMTAAEFADMEKRVLSHV